MTWGHPSDDRIVWAISASAEPNPVRLRSCLSQSTGLLTQRRDLIVEFGKEVLDNRDAMLGKLAR